MRYAILGLLLAALAAPATAQLYKWKDSQGNIIYSDRPPPDAAQKATTLKAPSSGPAAAPAQQKSLKEQELDFRQRQAEQAEAAAKARKEADLRAQNCASARSNLSTYTDGGRIVRFNAQGEREYVTDEDRAREIERWQAEVTRWCAPG